MERNQGRLQFVAAKNIVAFVAPIMFMFVTGLATAIAEETENTPTAGTEAPAANAASTIAEATHEQVKVLKPTGDDAKLKLTAFCLTKDGNIAALVNRADPPAANILHASEATSDEAASASEEQTPQTDAAIAEAPEKSTAVSEVRILDVEGKLLAQWPIDFEAQAINVDADGNVVLGGDGYIARYDLSGKQLAKGDSPQMAHVATSEKELEDQAREALRGVVTSIEESIETYKKQKEELAARKDEDLNEEERSTKLQLDGNIQSYEAILEEYKSPKEPLVKQTMQQLAGRARRINAMAANDKYVFVTCGDPKGFGYSVWRIDMDFQNPKQIVTGLSGCCGQMDVQCFGEELIVAENSRKRVVRYDADGKKIASFGKGSRDGAGATFGGCCNPMNTRLSGDKLYVSDSDGRVRLFSLDGQYQCEVGKAIVKEGCKSSTVDISANGDRVFYIDVNTSQICVLDRKPAKVESSVQ